MILHITTGAAWAEAARLGSYSAPSLGQEGFIHCSTPEQVVATASRFFHGRRDLVLLCIMTELVRPAIRYEAPTEQPDSDERFPHIYGPLNVEAVASVLLFESLPDGSFELPPQLGPMLKRGTGEQRPAGLLVRQAAADELELVHELTQAAYAGLRATIGESGVYRETPGLLRERLEAGWVILLAEINGEPAGAARITTSKGELYLGRLAVVPAQRRRGIGEALVRAAEAWGRAWGLPGIRLGAREALPENRRFYERLGYTAGQRQELDYAPGVYFNRMTKRLLESDPTSITVETYERYAPQFAARTDRHYQWASIMLDRLAQLMPPPALVGAVGCGPGAELRALSARGYRPIGLDRTAAMLRLAAASGTPLARADLRALPFGTGTLDALWVSASLLHLPRLQIAIATSELRRVARPQGALLLSLKLGNGEQWRQSDHGPRFFAFYQPDEVRRLLHGARFEVVYQWTEESRSGSQDDWVITLARAC